MSVPRSQMDTDLGSIPGIIQSIANAVAAAIAKNNDFTTEDTQIQSIISQLNALLTQVQAL